jgi:hypothetical protein
MKIAFKAHKKVQIYNLKITLKNILFERKNFPAPCKQPGKIWAWFRPCY